MAQVSGSLPVDPNFRPAMKTTCGASGSRASADSSSRSQRIVSTPHASSVRCWSGEEKRETPMTRWRQAGGVHGAPGHPRERGSHLAGDAQHDHVAVRPADRLDRRVRGLAQQLFEMRDVANYDGPLHRLHGRPIMNRPMFLPAGVSIRDMTHRRHRRRVWRSAAPADGIRPSGTGCSS